MKHTEATEEQTPESMSSCGHGASVAGSPVAAGVSVAELPDDTVGGDAVTAPHMAPQTDGRPRATTTVLLIEDDPSHAHFIERTLANAGGRSSDLKWAKTLSEGIECLSAKGIDLVLLDLSLPDSRGIATLRTVLTQGPDVPVVVLTGLDCESTAVEAVKEGAQDYLVKNELNSGLLARAVCYAIERKRAQKALLAAQERHRLLIEGLPVGLFRMGSSLEGRFLLANQALFGMFGHESREEFLQVAMPDLWEQPGDWVELHGRLMAEGQVVSQEARLMKSDGTPFWAAVTTNVVREASGEVQYVNGLIEDVTERKLLETQLGQAQKLEAMGQLAAGIAHEINTPIQYVGDNTRFAQEAFADLVALVREYDRLLTEADIAPDLRARLKAAAEEADVAYLSEELPAAIRQSLDGVSRVVEIVRAMKEFSHPNTDEKVPTDLNEIIRSTITLARNEWKYVAEVQTDFDDVLPPVPILSGDIKQVILNMLVNAAHAIGDVLAREPESRGTIAVTTRHDGDFAEIRIADTGTGIPEEVRPKVFNLFFTTKAVGKGTGQGLAISRAVVVEKHGGTITFQSEVGKGTTFVIRLPMRPPTRS
ncbi:MAG: ATP-binding protein [Phycisphaerae bacterium]